MEGAGIVGLWTEREIRMAKGVEGIEKLKKHMIEKLEANAHKPLWTKQRLAELLDHAHEELDELRISIEKNAEPAEVWREAADVGLLAMMAAQAHEEVPF